MSRRDIQESIDDINDQEDDDDEQYQAKFSIDRELYNQRYRDLLTKLSYENIRNAILHKRLVEYYKKRKMDYALRELDVGMEDELVEEQYKDKLLTYRDMDQRTTNKIIEIEKNIEDTMIKKQIQEAAIKHLFLELQTTEKHTGCGLIYQQKGTAISDKLIDRLLSIQKSKFYESAELHLRYIRARNAVNSLEEELQSLETIAPGREISGFESLTNENQTLVDKIEERDNDLVKNRVLYAQYDGMLAHLREKMNHNEAVIEAVKADLGDVELEHLAARAELNGAKRELDNQRALLQNYKDKAGLLTKLDLLADFGETQKKYDTMEQYTDKLRRQVEREKFIRAKSFQKANN